MSESAADHPAAANIFPDALTHVAERKDWRWHRGASAPHSSQALCVSVWGTLATRPHRASVLKDVLALAGLPAPGPGTPHVVCEAQDPSRLNEYPATATPTSIDVAVRWGEATLAIESKLTERQFGACGQTAAHTDSKSGKNLGPACDGRHWPGSDRKTGTPSPCRLRVWDGTRSPRLYWDVGSELFRPDVLRPADAPCPFAGPAFQLMRNLAWAAASAPARTRRATDGTLVTTRPWFGLLVAHAATHPNAPATVWQFEAFRDLLLGEVAQRVGIVSYEQIASVLSDHGENQLAAYVLDRVSKAAAKA